MKKRHLYLMVVAAVMAVSSVSVSAVDIQTSGAIRVRDQIEMKSGAAGDNTQRNRIRLSFQYGGKAMVAENVEAGFGIATMGDHRSLNTTFGTGSQPTGSTANSTAFAQPNVAIDYAYIKHTKESMSVTLGRFRNPFFTVSQLIWDNDIRGEGAAFNYNLTDLNANITAAWYALDEKSSGLADSNMVIVQAAHSNTVMDLPVKGALTYYGTAFATGDSTVFGGTALNKELAAWQLAGEVSFVTSFVDRFRAYGDFVTNSGATTNDRNGILLGANFGSKKLAGPGTWEGDISYRYLQKAAFVPALVDSDFLSGATQSKGWTGSLKYAVDRDLIAGITYRQAYDLINFDQVHSMVQLDLSTKF